MKKQIAALSRQQQILQAANIIVLCAQCSSTTHSNIDCRGFMMSGVHLYKDGNLATLVDMIEGKVQASWSIWYIVEAIKHIISQIQVIVSPIFREGNQVADSLAKLEHIV